MFILRSTKLTKRSTLRSSTIDSPSSVQDISDTLQSPRSYDSILDNDMNLDGKDWIYVAEGGANIIFRYAPEGKNCIKAIIENSVHKDVFYGKLLRVKKREVVAVPEASAPLQTLQSRRSSHYPHPKNVVDYATDQIQTYFDNDKVSYEQVARLLPVTKEFLQELHEQVRTLKTRPTHRCKTEIDVTLQYVMLLPEMILHPFSSHKCIDLKLENPKAFATESLCVELKPKIGFKPQCQLLPAIKRRMCRFCMHQYLKLDEEEVEERSKYCPLNLFSQNPIQMKKALLALQETPQNNWKTLNHTVHRPCSKQTEAVNLVLAALLKLNVMDDLLELQKLDRINIDGMWHLKKLLDRLTQLDDGIGSTNSSDTLSKLVNECRTKHSKNIKSVGKGESINEEDFTESSDGMARSIAFLEYALSTSGDPEFQNKSWESLSLSQLHTFYKRLEQQFQIATTLKDCSIVVCLRQRLRRYDEHRPFWKKLFTFTCEPLQTYLHEVVVEDTLFDCAIAVVDLDVKHHKTIDDYYNLDAKIIANVPEDGVKDCPDKLA